MGASVGDTVPPGVPRVIPKTGMRGGLGRTLLSAFLVLTILPLALVGWYAVHQNRRNSLQDMESRLRAVAALKAQQLRQWVEDRQTLWLVTMAPEQLNECSEISSWWQARGRQVPEVLGVAVQDRAARSTCTVGTCLPAEATSALAFSSPDTLLLALTSPERQVTVCLQPAVLAQFFAAQTVLDSSGVIYLVQGDRVWPGGEAGSSVALTALQAGRSGTAFYVNHRGVSVVGAYEFLPDLGVGVLVEQEPTDTLNSSDGIAATFIVIILGVVLATTAISAVVIRQITRPVIRLTESALAMAEGNLEQHVPVTSRDEIGILTYVFNEMATDLKSLYDDLEAKVVERTRMLQQANYQIQRRVLHLQASSEVSQAITSVRDPGLLLNQVAELIRRSFAYASVAVYLTEPGGGEARLRAVSPDGGVAWPPRVHAGEGSVVERALRKGIIQVESRETTEEVEWHRRTLEWIVVPLRMEERCLGVLAVLSMEREGLQQDDLQVLEHLANQVAIALENARAYERERQATRHLEEAERFKARFLTNMSHDLREPLNTVIGFSRLILKGLDGPLQELQRDDLQRVYDNSQRLLALINDMLDISQIQAGLMELKLETVNLREVIESVLPTAGALVRGKEIVLAQEIAPALPVVQVDVARIRQVLVRLLTNAAKFTERGQITLRAWADEEQVYISVSDTGVGIPPADRERIFMRFEKSIGLNGVRSEGAGLGLALSKEFVEMHGGRIWVESEVGQGSTFTFSLPRTQEARAHAEGGGGNRE